MAATLSLSLSQLRPFACSLGCSIVHWTVAFYFVHNFAIFKGFILKNGACCRNVASIDCHRNLRIRFLACAATDSISLISTFVCLSRHKIRVIKRWFGPMLLVSGMLSIYLPIKVPIKTNKQVKVLTMFAVSDWLCKSYHNKSKPCCFCNGKHSWNKWHEWC